MNLKDTVEPGEHEANPENNAFTWRIFLVSVSKRKRLEGEKRKQRHKIYLGPLFTSESSMFPSVDFRSLLTLALVAASLR